MSVPQSKMTLTTESPTAEEERTAVTPGVPLIALSIGNVTRDSISSGASPGASV